MIAATLSLASRAHEHSRRIAFDELPAAIQRQLAAEEIDGARFSAFVTRVEAETTRRVAEGEREHLIYFALQSTRFTDRPPIEPALSAWRFVERLPETERARLLDDRAFLPKAGWPPGERDRAADLIDALERPPRDARIAYFHQLLGSTPPHVADLYPDYVRVARFLYLKEWAASAPPADAERVARLYQTRAHSSDTQVEAGFGVSLGFGVLRGLESSSRRLFNNVLIVGPGMDLAPRTDLIDVVPPQSYQPFAVADALLALSLASEADLRVHSVDVNPRVVSLLEAIEREPVTLHWFAGISEAATRPLSEDYAAYARTLGFAIGGAIQAPRAIASAPRYLRSIAVRRSVARAITAGRLNIVTERLIDRPGFDLIVATNVLAYFDDTQLALALSNIAAMLRPGGYFVHNESRRGLAEAAAASDLPVVHMRTAVIGGPPDRPLYDAVWLHRKGS